MNAFTDHADKTIRVRTPRTFPDGTLVDVYVCGERNGVHTITDYGETLDWLRLISPHERPLVLNAIPNGVMQDNGTLFIADVQPADINSAILKLASAIVKIANMESRYFMSMTAQPAAMDAQSQEHADNCGRFLTQAWRIRPLIERTASQNRMDAEEVAWCEAALAIYDRADKDTITPLVALWLILRKRSVDVGMYINDCVAGTYEDVLLYSRRILRS